MLKSFRAVFYRKADGCQPFYSQIVCQTKKAAMIEAVNTAKYENARLVSMTETKD